MLRPTTYFHIFIKRPVSNTTLRYRTLKKKMVSSNKEVNRHIRNILFVLGPVINWSRLLCTTERVLNNFVKQPLGVSPNTLLFGNAFSTDRSLLTQIDQDVSGVKQRSTQDFFDSLIARQALRRYTRKQPSMRPTKNGTLNTHITQSYGNGWKRKWTITPAQPNLCQIHSYSQSHGAYTTTYIRCHECIQVRNPFSGSWNIFNRSNLTLRPSTQ